MAAWAAYQSVRTNRNSSFSLTSVETFAGLKTTRFLDLLVFNKACTAATAVLTKLAIATSVLMVRNNLMQDSMDMDPSRRIERHSFLLPLRSAAVFVWSHGCPMKSEGRFLSYWKEIAPSRRP